MKNYKTAVDAHLLLSTALKLVTDEPSAEVLAATLAENANEKTIQIVKSVICEPSDDKPILVLKTKLSPNDFENSQLTVDVNKLTGNAAEVVRLAALIDLPVKIRLVDNGHTTGPSGSRCEGTWQNSKEKLPGYQEWYELHLYKRARGENIYSLNPPTRNEQVLEVDSATAILALTSAAAILTMEHSDDTVLSALSPNVKVEDSKAFAAQVRLILKKPVKSRIGFIQIRLQPGAFLLGAESTDHDDLFGLPKQIFTLAQKLGIAAKIFGANNGLYNGASGSRNSSDGTWDNVLEKLPGYEQWYELELSHYSFG